MHLILELHQFWCLEGQFKPNQLFEYYMDLKSDNCTAFLALVHSRFSTNSFPSWNRAHPFRRIAHNGALDEITPFFLAYYAYLILD